MIKVKVSNIEKALKEYKSKRKKCKVSEEISDRKQYVKKSVKNRRKKLKAIFKNKKNN
jgi:ribosomal protein S21